MMEKSLLRKAYAKINLSLDVLRRREDGYHEVKMVMQTIDLYDELSFKVIPSGIELNILDVPKDADLGPIEKNLIYRAAKMVLDEFNINKGVSVTLNKHIPVAAGMAGGSTDAAAVFHALNELFELNMTTSDMCKMGVKLGADIPYCIMGGTYLSEGIGEVLTKLNTPPQSVLVIAKPDIDVSTKFVYENLHANELKYHPDVDGMIEAINEQNLAKMSSLLGNVLETVTTREYPVIESIKDVMKENGALNALMSGSGPTVFGIFGSDNDIKNVEKASLAKQAIIEKGLAKEVFVTKFVNV